MRHDDNRGTLSLHLHTMHMDSLAPVRQESRKLHVHTMIDQPICPHSDRLSRSQKTRDNHPQSVRLGQEEEEEEEQAEVEAEEEEKAEEERR